LRELGFAQRSRRGRSKEPSQIALTRARGEAQNRATATFVGGLAFPLHSLRLLTVGLALLAATPAAGEPAVTPVGGGPPAPPAAGADNQSSDTEVAEHVAQGRRLYLLGHYQEAIAEYRRAYELRADPQFLMDTAEAYRQLGATERALFYYERYVAAAPNAPDREIVEDRITELELVKTAPPVASAVVAAPAVPATRPRPVWKRWWVWTAVGVALAAGITATALSTRSTAPSVPATDLGDRKFY
jgi:tetratricopeptide (TPR) repeat protein